MRLISTPKSRLKAYYVANYVRGNAVGSCVLWARTFATKSTFILILIDLRVQSKPDRKATLSLGVYITKLLSPITRLPLQREQQAKYKRHNTASNQTRQPFFLAKSPHKEMHVM